MLNLWKKFKFAKALRAATEDFVLTDQEGGELKRLSEELGISQLDAEKMRFKDFTKKIKPLVDDIRTTRRMTSDQGIQLAKISEGLKVNLTWSPDLIAAKNLWLLENHGKFRPEEVQADIRLEDNSSCFYKCSSDWQQMKFIRKERRDALVSVSDGEMYMTNDRFIFSGEKKSVTIPFKKIIKLEPYKDAVVIHRSSGKPDYFSMKRIDAEYINALFSQIS